MSSYVIDGGNSLVGTVDVCGGKNAVLPLLSAALLCSEGTVRLCNCPDITDVTYTISILKNFGCDVSFDCGQITINAEKAFFSAIPENLCAALRSACLFLGASIGRFGKAKQYLPGGCNLGCRPIDLHLEALEKMGALSQSDGKMLLLENSPHGTDIFLKFPSVGATENIILAAALAKGTTTITGAAREPEISELCSFINGCGGNIRGAGTDVIIIQGVEKLRGISYNVMGDRIEAATYLALALATDGEITVKGVKSEYLNAFTDVLVNCGGFVLKTENAITAKRSGHFLFSAGYVQTGPYPAFPTDAQSILVAMLLKSQGKTRICEKIFDGRFKVIEELRKMGADVYVKGDTAFVTGTSCLHGANLTCPDLRSGAALVLAALCANGKSVIRNVCYINRGYTSFVPKLRALGADIIETEDV